jgi:hypothetical protein
MRIIKNILLISALVLSVSHAKSYTKTKYIRVTKSYKTTVWKTKEVPYQKVSVKLRCDAARLKTLWIMPRYYL